MAPAATPLPGPASAAARGGGLEIPTTVTKTLLEDSVSAADCHRRAHSADISTGRFIAGAHLITAARVR